MKRFQFRLEKLLEMRRREEQTWEIRLAKISGECQRLRNSLQGKREEARRRGLTRYAGGFDMASLQVVEQFALRLRREADQEEQELRQREKKLHQVRQDYLKASRARKALDKLKEKREKEYYDMILSEERKTLDEMNGSQAVRRLSSHREAGQEE